MFRTATSEAFGAWSPTQSGSECRERRSPRPAGGRGRPVPIEMSAGRPFNKIKKHPDKSECFFILSSPSERHSFFTMTVAAQELIKSVRIWLKWELFYFGSAFWTFPISLIHLSLKTGIILLIRHFCYRLIICDLFDSGKMALFIKLWFYILSRF